MSYGSFSQTVTVLEKVLTLRTMRHDLLSSNVANLDTPGYRAVDLNFAQELDRIQNERSHVRMVTTHRQHLPQGPDQGGELPTVAVENPLQTVANDGNSVDIEKEMAKLAENHLMYNAVAQLLGQTFSGLKYAIDEGGK